MKVLLFGVAPAVVVAGFCAAIVLFHACKSHFHPGCHDLERLLTAPGVEGAAACWLLLGFAAGMTMSMIVRLVLKPAQARWADRGLMLLGLLAVPGAGYLVFSMPGGDSGWGPLVAVLASVLAAMVYGAWLLGFAINRAAFAGTRETGGRAP